MTEEQKQQIKDAAKQVKELAKQQDELYNNLIKSLGFEEYEKRWADGSDERRVRAVNPCSQLFDIIYNDHHTHDIDKQIEYLINFKKEYDNYGDV